ncbi:putative secreted protein (Por secretion system target) [Aquimarina sp. MAR_2010_214]|uniref:T9SS type A sorting domain-containing protein n=1 Tax=Aquimarina sp. MAR_2010_214 TaxID=1250026 RepID=UPI000CB9E418|nr:T9SS type A sorting domain-containing protein [Aquimarina sp. MAR_2010_214]PKV48823.1 putative secreted protein (Por secretion system target) [Aquimarina sp. MAR_2010_214]
MKQQSFLNRNTRIFLLFMINISVFAQDVTIANLSETYSKVTFSPQDFDLLKSGSNALRGLKKIQLMNSSPWITETSVNWPLGAWGRGYYYPEIQNAEDNFVNEEESKGKFWGCHPLPRETSKFSRGHLQAYLHTNDPTQIEFVKDGIDYLLDQQVKPDPQQNSLGGGFIAHINRESQFSVAEYYKNAEDAYTTAFALRLLSEYYLSGYNYKRTEVYNAIVKASDWLTRDEKNIAQSMVNSNGKGLTIWGLSSAYKATLDCKYLSLIYVLTQQLIDSQDKTSTINKGVWFTGGIDDIKQNDQKVTEAYHDTKIGYHMLIIRGLVEVFDIIPEQYSVFKKEVVNTINRAINHVTTYRVNEYDSSKKRLKEWWVKDHPTNTGILEHSDFYVFSNTNSRGGAGSYIEPIVLLTYYGKDSEHYSAQDLNHLKNIANCFAKELSSNEPEHMNAVGYYTNYLNAVSNNTSVLSWTRPNYIEAGFNASEITGKVVSGDFDNDGYKDDIAAFFYYQNGLTKINVWKSNNESLEYQGSNGWWQSPSWYNSNNITDRVVVGDFDNDGYEDDIAAFYKTGTYETTIHVWKSNGGEFLYAGSNGWWNTNGYDSDKVSGRVVSGDFDGDTFKDDIAAFYDNGNGNSVIHVWKSNGSSLSYKGSGGWWNPNSGYDANQITGRVVSGDFDGNNTDEIAAFYDNGNGNSVIHVWKYNGSNFTYSNGSNGWWNPNSGYDANQITGRVVSGNFYNHSHNRDEIAAFYDNGNSSGNIHFWKFNGGGFSYDKGSSGWWNTTSYDAKTITGRITSGNFDNNGAEDIVGLSRYDENDTKAHVWVSNSNTTEFDFTGQIGWWDGCNDSNKQSVSGNNKVSTKSTSNNHKFDKNIKIHPNPTNGVLNILVNENETINKVRVYDSSGKEIDIGIDYLNNTSVIRINTNNLGLYLITISTNKNIYHQKIIIN